MMTDENEATTDEMNAIDDTDEMPIVKKKFSATAIKKKFRKKAHFATFLWTLVYSAVSGVSTNLMLANGNITHGTYMGDPTWPVYLSMGLFVGLLVWLPVTCLIYMSNSLNADRLIRKLRGSPGYQKYFPQIDPDNYEEVGDDEWTPLMNKVGRAILTHSEGMDNGHRGAGHRLDDTRNGDLRNPGWRR